MRRLPPQSERAPPHFGHGPMVSHPSQCTGATRVQYHVDHAERLQPAAYARQRPAHAFATADTLPRSRVYRRTIRSASPKRMEPMTRASVLIERKAVIGTGSICWAPAPQRTAPSSAYSRSPENSFMIRTA